MNISYNWLKDLVEINLTPQEVAEKLTSVGLAVEGIHPHEDDFVFDIDLTSNRGDCLSHLGVARELSAITNSRFRIPNSKLESQLKTENSKLITIEDADICNRFTARIIRNVKISPSPKWLVDRLEAIGQRSINNVADITNYVMHELGNPMHSFDYNSLAENRIIVRRAKAGEKMHTLDEVERTFNDDMLLICDAEKPVSIAGIMGGQFSGITDETTDVLLEVAYFKRESIRETSRKLKLNTEASHHFERGVDIENLIRASNRATDLICELAGGTAEDFVDTYPTKRVEKSVKFNYDKVKQLTGLEIPEAEIDRILNALGIEKQSQIANQKSQIFTVPSWRHDISIEQDLVEEVARIYGYDKIGSELPPTQSAGEYQPTENRKKFLRTAMSNLGFDEAISYSFIKPETDETFELISGLVDENADEKFVTLQDSIIEGAVRMRPSLLSGLLDSVKTNFNYQRKDLKLFELGKVFASQSPKSEVQSPRSDSRLPQERELFSIVLTGNETYDSKAVTGKELDFYDAKGALEIALNAINLPKLHFSAKDVKHLRKGQSAEISLGGKTVGTIGRINDSIAESYKFKQPVFVAEIDLQTLFKSAEQNVFYKPLSKFPSKWIDVSLLVKRTTPFAEIVQAVESAAFMLCEGVTFVDAYEGKGVADDERSITVRFSYRSIEKTLTDAEVDETHQKILSKLAETLNARQRF
jgi:phenylalanyl-tRNA synthetase beta chain